MKRRDFLKTAGAVYGASLLSGSGFGKLLGQSASAVSGQQPNILFILVDELRFPSVFPKDVLDAGGFLRKFMPNLYTLWQRGVKFGSHYTAANACTPARGTLITGLYSQQSWVLTTLLAQPTETPSPADKIMPALDPTFPTYGKLLEKLGYTTPYCGKWHLSVPNKEGLGLKPFGFDFKLYPDPTGSNLQGTYGDEAVYVDKDGKLVKYIYHSDADTVDEAIKVLDEVRRNDRPFCLTVSLINPHDREFFPAGTEYQTVNKAFADQEEPKLKQMMAYPGDGPHVPWEKNALKSPPDYGYAALPPNWESESDWQAQGKPSTQTFIKDFQQLVWGGVTEDARQIDFSIEAYKATQTRFGVVKAPFSYWQRGMDSYTQIMEILDVQIGRVLDKLNSLPRSVVENTVIIFTSDHGEYSGAHGMPSGKLGTVYDEAFHIPLIVVDPSDRFTKDTENIRTGLTSSVDMLPLFASLGAKGTNAWMTPELRKIYAGRHDLLRMLTSSEAPGRSYVVFATDEIAPSYFNFNNAPTHLLGLRTQEYKLGLYAEWHERSSVINPSTVELEFYDYATEGGRLETINTPSDPRASATVQELVTKILPNEMQATLPPQWRLQQAGSKVAQLAFRNLIEDVPAPEWEEGGLEKLLGYGGPF